MKWVKVSTGISPSSNIVLVIRGDSSLVIANKHAADNAFGFRFYDYDGNDIMQGLSPLYFMDIWLPFEELDELLGREDDV